MSYAFDTLMQVWQKRVDPLIEDRSLAGLFEMLFEEIHSANHEIRVQDARGVLRGDAVNKAVGVTSAARDLEAHDRELATQCAKSVEVQRVTCNEQRVTLSFSGFEIKSLLLSLGREIRKRSKRLEKREQEGRMFVPEPGHRNIEVLTLERFKEVYEAIRSQVEFDMRDGWNKDKLPEGAMEHPPGYGCTPKGGE